MKYSVWTGVAFFQYFLGAFLYFSGIAKAHHRVHDFTMRCLQRAADLKHQKAELLMGKLLRYRGVNKHSQLVGLQYLRRSAAQGQTEAQFLLAEALVDDHYIAREAYIDASMTVSQSEVNQTVNVDADEAPVTLYLAAAESGHVMAALRLSKIYEQGKFGVEIDTEKSTFWLEEFMKHGKQK